MNPDRKIFEMGGFDRRNEAKREKIENRKEKFRTGMNTLFSNGLKPENGSFEEFTDIHTNIEILAGFLGLEVIKTTDKKAQDRHSKQLKDKVIARLQTMYSRGLEKSLLYIYEGWPKEEKLKAKI
jgi:hypothetical protein